MDKLSIHNEMSEFDRKNRNFYDELTDEERKKFSTYLMIRWGSAVNGSAELQEYYLRTCNENFNKHFFDIGRHPKLQWLCATTVSPGLGTQRHQWIAPKKKDGGNNKVHKFLQKLLPNAKLDEIELLAKINDTSDLRSLAREHGWSEQDIKSSL
jgi:hypothetical protein